MTRRSRPSPTRLAPATFVAMVALAAFAPRSAEAGCSSRVHGEGRAAPSVLAALAELTDGDPHAPGRIPPCSGPSCSDGPGTPMAPTLLAPDAWRDLWDGVAAIRRRDLSGRPLTPPGGEPDAPAAPTTDVERPPRRPAA